MFIISILQPGFIKGLLRQPANELIHIRLVIEIDGNHASAKRVNDINMLVKYRSIGNVLAVG